MRERRGQMNERKERGKIWIKGWIASDETGLEPAKHTASLGIIYIYIYIVRSILMTYLATKFDCNVRLFISLKVLLSL